MKAKEAVQVVLQHVKDTGESAIDSVRKLWPQLLPIEDIEELAQPTLAFQVTVEYRRGHENDSVQFRPPIQIGVQHIAHQARNYKVTVDLLRDVRYNINGKVKTVAVMGRADVGFLARQAEAVKEGAGRYQKFWEGIGSRLETTGKRHVEDLADGEQLKIAKQLHELQKRNHEGLTS
jgi:hypothetical protein